MAGVFPALPLGLLLSDCSHPDVRGFPHESHSLQVKANINVIGRQIFKNRPEMLDTMAIVSILAFQMNVDEPWQSIPSPKWSNDCNDAGSSRVRLATTRGNCAVLGTAARIMRCVYGEAKMAIW